MYDQRRNAFESPSHEQHTLTHYSKSPSPSCLYTMAREHQVETMNQLHLSLKVQCSICQVVVLLSLPCPFSDIHLMFPLNFMGPQQLAVEI